MFSLTSGIPIYYNQLLHETDKFLDHSKNFWPRVIRTKGLLGKITKAFLTLLPLEKNVSSAESRA